MPSGFARLMTDSRELNQVQNNVANAINPLLNNPILNGNFLNGVQLFTGGNVLSHGLGRTQQGWFLTDILGLAEVYRTGSFNSTTFELVSDADVVVNIYVF